MVRTVRPARRPSTFSLSLLAAVAAGSLSCGKGKAPGKDDAGSIPGEALHIISTPVRNTQVGGSLTYQAATSEPGAATWAIESGPKGATIDQGGQVTYEPTAAEAGSQSMTISATQGGLKAEQTFEVNTASSAIQASTTVKSDDPNGASLIVDAPLSEVHGAALQIDPGSTPPGDAAISIASMSHPPEPPAGTAAMISAKDLKPVELGPTGLAFTKPAKLQMPIPGKLLANPNLPLALLTYDYGTGHWRKVKVLNVDRKAGVLVGEIQHFSTYVVAPEVKIFNLEMGLGSGAACADSLVVRAPLVPAFADVPAAGVNGYKGTAKSVAEILSTMAAGDALQVYTRVRAHATIATGEQAGWSLAAALKLPDGKLKVSVTSDSHAGAFLKVPAGGLAATDPELLAWMNGSRVNYTFGALGTLSGGAVADAEVSLYLVPGLDADRPPPASANALGTDGLEVAKLQIIGGAGADDDCDGAPNMWDPEPQGPPPPVLVGMPPSPVHVAVGSPMAFKISSPQDGVTFVWSASDPSVTIASAMGGTVGTATAEKPGFFTVTVTGARAGATSRFNWDVIADPPAVAAANMPPFVAVSASANLVRAGETVKLLALGKDDDQSPLTFAWAASDATVLSSQLGETIAFTAMAPGDYVVTCVARDGSGAASMPAKVTITVLSPTANRPPSMPSVSPLGAALTHAPGGQVSLQITAQADDPDGDALTYDFAPDPATPPTFSLMKSGASATFTSTQDGVYVFYVTATDPQGARSPWAIVKILVLPNLPPAGQATDADKDGYPAGFDCNDGDAAVHPGAKEICGDGKDQDCDGRDLAGVECDADGDRFTPAVGDCDDKNPAINPQMPERCDGIDNNCNDKKDEGFDVGVDCVNGVGACQVAAKTVCSASYGSVVCGGTPGMPTTETCDGKDNDCNGRVDDVPGMLGGDSKNCGGCGIACTTTANSTAACLMGGCVSMCAAGFVDADRNPVNGCECQLSNSGVEICDGKDNDCNGAVDEGVGMQVYGGPAGTAGVGICAPGLAMCKGGELVPVRPPTMPTTEVCDGLDNDCNGKVDDGVDFMNDGKNCGACGVVCAGGMACQNGRCPGGTTMMGGADGGVSVPPDGGIGGGGMLAICNVAGSATCVDLGQDQNNCGACGRVCPATQFCGGGVCMNQPPISCPAGAAVCTDPMAAGKQYCTMTSGDPRNCGACGNVCPNGAGCSNGTCTGGAGAVDAGTMTMTGQDAGAAMAGGCPGIAPNQCPGAGGSMYCANLQRDANNCGTCGHGCSPSQICTDGVCMAGGAAGAACGGGGLTMCPTGCTSTQDDFRNCSGCGIFCDGSCNMGQCLAPGQRAFGSSCTKNADCGGNFCIDQMRFGWPMGFCSSLCDADLPCPNGQTCVGSPTSGSFGYCKQACTTDAECGRAGFVCNFGSCQPTCTSGSNICQNGMQCDGPTGRCIQPTCNFPQQTCPTIDGRSTYCTDVYKDPANCGGCGRFCPNGMACNDGVCGGAPTCGAPLQACSGAGGGMYCTDTSRDSMNCGGCGKPCAGNAFCSNGTCQGGGGTYPGLAACQNGGAPVCTNLYSDTRNCGSCGHACLANENCYGGQCGATQTMPQCPADAKACFDQAGTKMYCANVRFDSQNCGMCGRVCGAGMVCSDGQCTQGGGGADGGTMTMTCPAGYATCMGPAGMPTCASVMYDRNNCGFCGHVCAATEICQNGGCQPMAGMPDAGFPAPNCPANLSTCYPAAAPGFCADFNSDTNNCGGCFKPCSAGFYCQNATCVPQGGGGPDGGATLGPDAGINCGGMTACYPPAMPPYCANTQFDRYNCGACGNPCPGGYNCMGGVCMPGGGGFDAGGVVCEAPMMPCDGTYCADPQYDHENCGGCHIKCGQLEICNQGFCEPAPI